MNQPLTDLSASQLRHAADVREKIDALRGELTQILGAASSGARLKPAVPKKRRMSAAARARIAAGARARWAKIKRATSNGEAKEGRRKMSAAAKAKLSAIARGRWKKARAAGRKVL